MAHRAIRIANVIYDAARRCFLADIDYFTPGIPQALRVPVRVPITQGTPHPALVREMVSAADRTFLHR